jgi:hypothetical protein
LHNAGPWSDDVARPALRHRHYFVLQGVTR